MSFLQDIRYAVRVFRNAPGFTAVALLALALGIGANTAIFSIVHGVLLEPLPYRDPEKLVLLFDNFRKLDVAGLPVSPPEFFDYRDRTHSFEGMAAYSFGNANLTGEADPERIAVGNVSANLFPLLGAQALYGRTFLVAEEQPGNDHVVVVSHGLWLRRFGGDTAVIGRSMTLEGEPYRIVGVMPPEFDFPAKTDVWSPLGIDPRQNTVEQRAGRWVGAIARLKPGITPEAARADIKRVAAENAASYPKNYPAGMGFETTVDTIADVTVGDVRPALRMLLVAVGLVLLIACANVANLLLGRGNARGREIAIRTALGARRSRLVRQLLTESLLLSLGGGVIGILLALWGTDLLRTIAPQSLPRMENVGIDGMVLAFTLGAVVLTSVIFGLIPALRLSRVRLSLSLRGVYGVGTKRRRLRSSLVVAEIAMAIVLLVGAGLMLRSFIRLNNVSPGFDANNVLTLKLSLPQSKYQDGPAVRDLYDRLLTRLRGLPGVKAAAAASIIPVDGGGLNRSFAMEGVTLESGAAPPVCEWRIVSPGYFGTMRIPLMEGRDFTGADRDSLQGVVIVNRSLARRYWHGESPVGKRIRFAPPAGDPWRTVVGVVGDVHHFGLDADPQPECYTPHAQFPVGEMGIAVRADVDPGRLLASVRNEIRSIDRDLPISDPATMEERLARSVVTRRLDMTLLLVFAGVALLLAAVGTYGVTAFSVSRRIQEFGIRMALGARPRDLLRMVLREGMIVSLCGVALGTVGALVATRTMASLLYNVDPFDPVTYLTVAFLLAGVALVACYIPARRATRIDPIAALRYE